MDWLSPDSYWIATAEAGRPAFPPLEGDLRADVAIIGGGITGLTCALRLVEAGRRVAVIEAGRIGAGTTGGTTAHLDALPDPGFSDLVRKWGEERVRLVTRARMAAIDAIENTTRDLGADCDFVRVPAYAYTESEDRAAALREECDAAAAMGLAAAPADAPLPFPVAFAFRVENQARVHAQRYLQVLARRLHERGCRIHEHTRAQPPQEGEPCSFRTRHGRVAADAVVVATHSAYLGVSQLDLRVTPHLSYVLAARVEPSVPDALYWDDEDPYHYARRASSDDSSLWLIGGADHKTGHGTPDPTRDLEAYARTRWNASAVERRWSAELYEPSDGLPYAGRLPRKPHVFAATGLSGTGMTLGTVAAGLVADLVLERDNPLEAVFAPGRFRPLAGGAKAAKENMNVAKRYVLDRVRAESPEAMEKLPRGAGCTVRHSGSVAAVYRDDEGALHAFSASCTHAGCIVQWNAFARTWDCPCHGGRYDPFGRRLYGPPPADLDSRPVPYP